MEDVRKIRKKIGVEMDIEEVRKIRKGRKKRGSKETAKRNRNLDRRGHDVQRKKY